MRRMRIPEGLPNSPNGKYFYVKINNREHLYTPDQYTRLLEDPTFDHGDKSIIGANTCPLIKRGDWLYHDKHLSKNSRETPKATSQDAGLVEITSTQKRPQKKTIEELIQWIRMNIGIYPRLTR